MTQADTGVRWLTGHSQMRFRIGGRRKEGSGSFWGRLSVRNSLPNMAPRRDMRTQKFKDNYTLCQTLRDIYAITKRKRIKEKCRIAMTMAKAMDRRLHEYKKIFEDGVKLNRAITRMDSADWEEMIGKDVLEVVDK